VYMAFSLAFSVGMFTLTPERVPWTVARDPTISIYGDDVFAYMLGDDGGCHNDGALPRNHIQCGALGNFLPTGHHIGFTVNFCERWRNGCEHFNHDILSV